MWVYSTIHNSTIPLSTSAAMAVESWLLLYTKSLTWWLARSWEQSVGVTDVCLEVRWRELLCTHHYTTRLSVFNRGIKFLRVFRHGHQLICLMEVK